MYGIDAHCPRTGQNPGYKNYDPSHPCSRCWEKYATPFSGPITYASWSTDGQSGSSPSFQRPLHTFRAPQASRYNYSSSRGGSSPGSVSDLSPSATTSRATYGSGVFPGASLRVAPITGGILPMSSYYKGGGGCRRARTPDRLPTPQMGPRGSPQRVRVVWGCRRVPAWRLAQWGTAVLAVWRERQDVIPDLRRDHRLCMRWRPMDVHIAQSYVVVST